MSSKLQTGKKLTAEHIKKLLCGLIEDTAPKQYSLLKEQLQARNREQLDELEDGFDFLYPHLDDPKFNIKIAEKKGIQ